MQTIGVDPAKYVPSAGSGHRFARAISDGRDKIAGRRRLTPALFERWIFALKRAA